MKSPGARARSLGAHLRKCREQADLTLRAAAEAAGWDKSMLSRIETGHRNAAVAEVAQLLGVYRVVGELRDELLAMARFVDQPDWWWHGNEGLPRSLRTLLDYESEAVRITNWAPLLVPGLLQTPDYARAWMRAYGIEPTTVELRVAERLRRQRMLGGEVDYVALVGESALRTPVSDATTSARQLAALRATAERQNVSIRVVPNDVVQHRGQLGAFLLLEFADAAPLVLVELLCSSVFMDEPQHTAAYLDAVAQLASVALSETESARMITQIQARWSDRGRADAVAEVQP